MIFWKNAQALNKATQGGFFFQKQLKPMGYYSGEKSTTAQDRRCIFLLKIDIYGVMVLENYITI